MKINTAIIFMAIFFFTSCKKNEDSNPAPTGGGDVTGVWALQKEYQSAHSVANGSLYWDTTMYFTVSTWELYSFHPDSTWGFFDSGGPLPQDTGTYRTINDNLYRTSVMSGNSLQNCTYKVENDLLELRLVDTFAGYKNTVIKTLKKL